MWVWNTNLPTSESILVGYICVPNYDLIHYGYVKANAYWVYEKAKVVKSKRTSKKIVLEAKKLKCLTYVTNDLILHIVRLKKKKSDKITIMSINVGS